MAGLPEVIGLLYRADWTRLSLSAELRSETDREPLPRLSRERLSRAWPGQRQDNGRYVGRGALLIGPGGRWRLECPVPGRGAEVEAAEGNDGERGWSWRPAAVGGPPPLPVEVNGAYPPVPELFCPSCLLGGYTLEELGPVTVAGRDAIAVAATPRRDVLGSDPGDRPYDRVEVAVDAELGILLRRIETSGGEFVTRTELTDVTMNPLEAADPARFAPPLGSHRGETPGEHRGETFSGPGGAADRAAGGLGALIRYVPHRNPSTTIACDGERRWQVHQDWIQVGPAAPLGNHIAFLVDACWLLRGRLSGGAELTYRGRPARQLRVTRGPGGEELFLRPPLMFFPADAIVDAETGCLLRLLSYSGDALAAWWELDDISTEPADPDEFRVHVPPGTRTVEETGNLIADAVAVMPGVTGTAARAAAEVVNRTAGAVSAARSFLDDLRGHR